MSIPIIDACKKRKRTTKLYGLQSFADQNFPIASSGPFRDNVRLFLQECCELEDYNVEGMPVWCTMLVHENRGFLVPLYTIEESVKHSLRPLCDHCQCTGWKHHLLTKRKYHMIIPVDGEWYKPLKEGVFDLQTHLLHGLIHCNGFGHLLCINGIESGSQYLSGREIMDLWDRICSSLHVRKITVEDVSKKRSMDLRLLYGVAYERSWFGQWGYRFCRGSFGVTEHNYERAIDILSSMELDKVIQDFSHTKPYRDVRQIILCYRNLSETQLNTIRDILKFMLTVKSRAPQLISSAHAATASSSSSKLLKRKALQNNTAAKKTSGRYNKFATVATNWDSRWSVRRMEKTANVIVNAIKEKKASNSFSNGGMTRQEARDAARLLIGDTGMIDFVLKSMNNVIVGGYIVHRAVNPSTRLLEFSIQEIGNDVQVDEEPRPVIVPEPLPRSDIIPGIDVYSDLSYLYTNVLLGHPESVVKLAVETILNSKLFVKEWPFRDQQGELLRFIFQVMPSLSDLETDLTRGFLPKEYIEVPVHATIGELKAMAQNAMRDTYCVMERFVVTDIEEMEEMEDDEVLSSVVEPGSELTLREYGINLDKELKYEGGADNWEVRCKCGAEDDDGERMVACDMCEIWQHTLCSGIEDAEAAPPLFVCEECCASLMPSRIDPRFEWDFMEASMYPSMAELGMDIMQ
ncbi:PHD finger protein MALE MEIOCYTE DEATH 1-like [Cornus florida]|uniref:PHD finger protein MALE MEIOCYTE DEATH 1-like n=1 Tax=Cornus florida TaxID=4283 RepID=UPI0028A27B75|nr:PHD finger protein MALE MEIOCYTE DEATH 1-like [Cornus florida]